MALWQTPSKTSRWAQGRKGLALQGQGLSKQWGRGYGAEAQLSTEAEQGGWQCQAGDQCTGQVHGIRVGQAGVQGSHIGGSRMQDPGQGGEKGGGMDAAGGFLPTLCPAHRESWGEGSLATPPLLHKTTCSSQPTGFLLSSWSIPESSCPLLPELWPLCLWRTPAALQSSLWPRES